MKSLKLGTFAGIAVYLHLTFLLLIGLLAWLEYRSTGSLTEAAMAVVYILALFTCVVLHEFGHALTARVFGVKTRDIILLPIGGVARLEKMPEKPYQEFLVAIAGPMVNVVIAALLVGGLSARYGWAEVKPALLPLTGMSNSFFLNLAKVNMFLVAFNMLPAFPMDGGRVVRSLMAMVMPYERATSVAATLGRGMAILFALEGFGLNTIPYFEGSFMLIIIAVFIWVGAGSEAMMAGLKAKLHNVRVSQLMMTNFRTLSPRDTVEWAAETARSGAQQDFPVADQGRVVGMVLRRDLEAAVLRLEPYLMIDAIMRRDVPSVQSTDMLDTVFTAITSTSVPLLPVVNRGLLVGLLPLERVLHMRNSTGGPGAQSRPAPAAPDNRV